MNEAPTPEKKDQRYWLNLTLAGVTAQVGCLTLVIVLAAVFGGIWLDTQFHSKPVFTIVLLVISVPISIVVMFFIVRKATSRIKMDALKKNTAEKEETLGKNA